MARLVPNTQTGSLTDHQQGTDDTLSGVDDASNVLYGDAFDMDDHARGGNDTLTGGRAMILVRAPTSTPSTATPSKWTAMPAAATTR